MASLGLIVRGFLIGLAEVIPGISGGSIAFITGIYDRLIESLASVLPNSWEDLRSGGYRIRAQKAFVFLIVLAIGMILGFACGLMSVLRLYDNQPLLFWGLVFGLLAGVCVRLVTETDIKSLLLFGLLGLILGVFLSWVPSFGDGSNLALYLVGGFLAFSAWILPGVSGSMVLLLLGLWLPMLHAIEGFEPGKILTFAAGLTVGLIVMPRIVVFLLRQYRTQLVALFCGLVASTTLRAWPWKNSGDTWVLPTQYEGDAQFVWVICMMVAGFLAVSSIFVYERMKRAN